MGRNPSPRKREGHLRGHGPPLLGFDGADAETLPEGKKRIVPAGQGEGHVAEILQELHTGGWEGFLSLEPHLVDFSGLAALEQDPQTREAKLEPVEAWELALSSLRDILTQIGVQEA